MGALIVVVSLLTAGISLSLLFTTPITITTFLLGLLGSGSLFAAALVFYLTAALKNASYQIQNGTLTLKWGGINIQLPQKAISDVVRVKHQTVTQFQGIRWPGYCLGCGQITFEGKQLPTIFLATGGIATQWIIITPHRAIAISPQEPNLFRNQLLQTDSRQETDIRVDFSLSLWGWKIWSDRLYWTLVGIAASINLLLLALLCTVYPQLPTNITAAQNLFLWPLLASASGVFHSLLGGWFHQQRQERFMAYLLATGAVTIQVAAVLTTLNLFIG